MFQISSRLKKVMQSIVRTGDKGTLFKPVSSFNNKLVVAEEIVN